ncbi:DUF4402 domain-containing protein [Salinimicrobium catena]|uniref:DUF4402 domain-containing protein n=1 Tax=Salinimicrobium catena TaxID=390640 RepID=UPI002FE442DE
MRNSKVLILCIIIYFFSDSVSAQKAITIESVQGTLDFGTFWTQSGGDITINSTGEKPIIDFGIIHLIQPNPTPVSIFITASANKDIYISETINNPADCILTVNYDKPDPFLFANNANTAMEVRVGATLTVPASPLPGPRNGSITVEFTYNYQ